MGKQFCRERGAFYIVRIFFMLIFGYPYYKLFKSSRRFIVQGRPYKYFYATYLVTWMNERAVEVPLFLEAINQFRGKRILEVGRVLPHYVRHKHAVLDKYEKGRGIINQDVVDFKPPVKYDLIISISTLEHVGWDESPRDKKKILLALKTLRRCLAPGGKIMVSFPVGYNPELDKLVEDNKFGFTEQYCMKRMSDDNRWTQVKWEDIRNLKYDLPYVAANGLVIGIINAE
ncbi:MAG: class I SAM-dependent methyltransferase [bacterium]|nr:class I SAM-dependent methyltransferase [bacterium]